MATDQSTSAAKMVRLFQAARIVESITGEKPHVATLHRWASRGLRGVKLRTAFAGGHRRTCDPWVREFFDEVTAAANGEHCSPESPGFATTSARLRHERADRDLAASGM